MMYAIFDGFDLGTGILLLFVRDEADRDMVVDTITPVWDGNETWIVLAGVGLFGGFPLAYGTILPALYLPFIIMVLSLAFRALSMEFRFLAGKGKLRWDRIFSISSIIASFCQGLIIGNLIDGLAPRTEGSVAQSHPLYFLTPFACSTGILVILLYSLIGSTWLNNKTVGALQSRFKSTNISLALMVLVCTGLLLLARKSIESFARRLTYQGLISDDQTIAILLFVIALLAILFLIITSRRKNDKAPFLFSVLLFICFGLLVITHLWPFIVPPYINLYQAGSPEYGNRILLISALVVIPIILSYIAFSYIVFKGKAKKKERYEPELARDEESLQQKGKDNIEKDIAVKQLNWATKFLLSFGWLILFFIVLGFLGDFAALGIIFVGNVLFLIFWYKYSKRNQSPNES